MMKKVLFFFLILFFIQNSNLLMVADEGNNRIYLNSNPVFKKTAHSFGKISEGEVVSYKFELKNKGTDLLEIYDVITSCGCTVANYNKTILPGKKDFITVTFNSKNRLGKQQKKISVITNSRHKQKIELEITAEVQQKIFIEPSLIQFEKVTKESKLETIVKIYSPRKLKYNFVLNKATVNNNLMKTDFYKISDNNYELRLKLNAQDAVNYYNTTVEKTLKEMNMDNVPKVIRGVISLTIMSEDMYNLDFSYIIRFK